MNESPDPVLPLITNTSLQELETPILRPLRPESHPSD